MIDTQELTDMLVDSYGGDEAASLRKVIEDAAESWYADVMTKK